MRYCCGFARAVVLLVAFAGYSTRGVAAHPNVLFIAIDDLNHWVGHLGRHPQAHTPAIDRLASQGLTFTQAYCMAPACNPSRASLMSGQRPSSTGCYLNSQDWHPAISEEKFLNSHFMRAGYLLFGAGKIYHGSYSYGGDWTEYFKEVGGPLTKRESADEGVEGIKFYPLTNSDQEMPDYHTVSFGIEKLKAKHEKPFFLAIGLVKPHMPFSVPEKWFEQFPLDSIVLPPYRSDDLEDIPPSGIRMAAPDGDHAAILKSGRWKEAVRAYLATIAFCDSQVGRLIEALDASPYKDNTIVVLWSDHGWSLGEKSHWRKFALWEEPTRTVFIWRVPGVTKPGTVCHRSVDYSTVYPTLCRLAGIDPPPHLEGQDLTPLLKDPEAPWEHPAITTHGFRNHAIRNDQWRYIRYANGDEELYHSQGDPLEYRNLAKLPEYAQTKAALARWLPSKDVPDLPKADEAVSKKNEHKKSKTKTSKDVRETP